VQETYVRAWAASTNSVTPALHFPGSARSCVRSLASGAEPTRGGSSWSSSPSWKQRTEEIVASDAPSPLDDLLARLEAGGLRQALHRSRRTSPRQWSFTTSRV